MPDTFWHFRWFCLAAITVGFGSGLLLDCWLVRPAVAAGPPLPTTTPFVVSGGSPAAPAVDLLPYEKAVSDESKEHLEFLERMDSKLEDDAIKLGASALAIFAGIFAWFEVQTRSDLKKRIASKMKLAIEKEVAEQAEVLRRRLPTK